MVVGVDGADWEYWTKLVPSWLCSAPLESQIGLTGSEWTSMLTGIPATTLGAYDYYGRAVGDRKDVIRYEDLAGHYWWEIAEQAGHSAAICRAPACYPPRVPQNGWLLCGVGARDTAHCYAASDVELYPPPVGTGRPGLIPDSYVFGSIMHYLGDRSLLKEARLKRLWRLGTAIGAAGLGALERRDVHELIDHKVRYSSGCSVGYIYVGLLDILLHTAGLFTWHDAEPPYRLVLEFITRLRAELQPKHLYVVSDHGGRGGAHRSCGVFAWTPSDVLPAVQGDVVLGPSRRCRGGPALRLMQRVEVLEAPWHPWTYEVARLVLAPLGLAPKPFVGAGAGMTYSAAEQERVAARLRELGYL